MLEDLCASGRLVLGSRRHDFCNELKAGADPYLENEMGLNSFDISKKFGPFPSVRRALEESLRKGGS